MTLFRKSENRTFPVTIVREEIKVVSVKGKPIEPGYGWVRLTQFQERTVEDMTKKLEEIYNQDPQLKGLVLDLRNDPGGLLDAAVAVSAIFLPDDVTVVAGVVLIAGIPNVVNESVAPMPIHPLPDATAR